VRDSATLLDIAFQPQPGDPYRIELPTDSFADLAQREVGRLRIGFTTAALASRSIDHECVAAVEQAAAVCEELGYDVEECVLPGDYEQLALAANAIASTHLAVMLDEEARRRGSPIREVELETLTSLMYNAGRRNSASDYVEAVQFVHSFCRTIGSVFRTYDVIMTSTLGSPPVQLGVINANASDLSNYSEVVLSFMPNTQLFNASGLPAASIPLAWSRAGVPIGIQFAANYGEEALLLQLATQLERACPWWSRRPAL
jgi:Asp-tRNA(Asn)/Glu-tRNA(Gln) amidotransferase A subunit family amidase